MAASITQRHFPKKTLKLYQLCFIFSLCLFSTNSNGMGNLKIKIKTHFFIFVKICRPKAFLSKSHFMFFCTFIIFILCDKIFLQWIKNSVYCWLYRNHFCIILYNSCVFHCFANFLVNLINLWISNEKIKKGVFKIFCVQ